IRFCRFEGPGTVERRGGQGWISLESLLWTRQRSDTAQSQHGRAYPFPAALQENGRHSFRNPVAGRYDLVHRGSTEQDWTFEPVHGGDNGIRKFVSRRQTRRHAYDPRRSKWKDLDQWRKHHLQL